MIGSDRFNMFHSIMTMIPLHSNHCPEVRVLGSEILLIIQQGIPVRCLQSGLVSVSTRRCVALGMGVFWETLIPAVRTSAIDVDAWCWGDSRLIDRGWAAYRRRLLRRLRFGLVCRRLDRRRCFDAVEIQLSIIWDKKWSSVVVGD